MSNLKKEQAAKAAIEHIKKKENIDSVVTNIKIHQLELRGFITVRGYDKNNKQKRFYVEINKIQNYTVTSLGE